MACLSASWGQTLLPAARRSISGFNEIGSIYAICEKANPLCREPAQEGAARFIDSYDVAQKEICGFTVRHRVVARDLDHVNAFGRNVAIERETCSFLTELLSSLSTTIVSAPHFPCLDGRDSMA